MFSNPVDVPHSIQYSIMCVPPKIGSTKQDAKKHTFNPNIMYDKGDSFLLINLNAFLKESMAM